MESMFGGGGGDAGYGGWLGGLMNSMVAYNGQNPDGTANMSLSPQALALISMMGQTGQALSKGGPSENVGAAGGVAANAAGGYSLGLAQKQQADLLQKLLANPNIESVTHDPESGKISAKSPKVTIPPTTLPANQSGAYQPGSTALKNTVMGAGTPMTMPTNLGTALGNPNPNFLQALLERPSSQMPVW